MRLDEILDQLLSTFKIPETLEEAIDYINKDPSIQTLVDDMAFKQVVINVLVAANIISEDDFNKSVKYFKNLYTKSFAKELMGRINEFNEQYNINDEIVTEDDIDDDDEVILEDDGHYDA